MSDYLGNLVNRIKGAEPVVYPRRGSRFEPAPQQRNDYSAMFFAAVDETRSPAATHTTHAGESEPIRPQPPSAAAPSVAATPPAQTVRPSDQPTLARPQHHPSQEVEGTPAVRAGEHPHRTTPERTTIDFQRVRRTVDARMRAVALPLANLQTDQDPQAVQHPVPAPAKAQTGPDERSAPVPAQGVVKAFAPRVAQRQQVIPDLPSQPLSGGPSARPAPPTPPAGSTPALLAMHPPVEPSVQPPPRLAPRPQPPEQTQVTAKVAPGRDRLPSTHEQNEGQQQLQPRVTVAPRASASSRSQRLSTPPAPTIRVTIGRILVRGTLPPAPPAPVQRPAGPAPRPSFSLDDYLQRRGGDR